MKTALKLLGIALCVLPPLISTLEHFPLWLARGETALCAISVLLLSLSALPLIRLLRAKMRSPSAWMLWLVLWILLRLLAPIVDALALIALISFPTSFLGAICFRLASRLGKNAPVTEERHAG